MTEIRLGAGKLLPWLIALSVRLPSYGGSELCVQFLVGLSSRDGEAKVQTEARFCFLFFGREKRDA